MLVKLLVIPVLFAVMNLIGFFLMRSDKRRARRGTRRIPEAILFAVAFFFGGAGSTIAMFRYGQKTRHWYFVVCFPLFALLSTAVAVVAEIALFRTLTA